MTGVYCITYNLTAKGQSLWIRCICGPEYLKILWRRSIGSSGARIGNRMFWQEWLRMTSRDP